MTEYHYRRTRHNGQSIVFTVPPKWAREHLTNAPYISIREDGDTLIIRPIGEPQ